jgi:(2Fe-2S) ferredoxin
MRQYRHYVFVCQNRRPDGNPKGSCAASGSEDIRRELKERIWERGLSHDVRVIGTTCLGSCEEGPVMAVFPGNVWYRRVELKDLDRIIEEHLTGDVPTDEAKGPRD